MRWRSVSVQCAEPLPREIAAHGCPVWPFASSVIRDIHRSVRSPSAISDLTHRSRTSQDLHDRLSVSNDEHIQRSIGSARRCLYLSSFASRLSSFGSPSCGGLARSTKTPCNFWAQHSLSPIRDRQLPNRLYARVCATPKALQIAVKKWPAAILIC